MEIKSQGERLRILLDRKKVLVKDAAGPLGYKNWQSLSRLFRQDELPQSVVEAAAQLLGVDEIEITGGGGANMGAEETRVRHAPKLKPEDALARAEEEIRRLREQVVEMGKTNTLLPWVRCNCALRGSRPMRPASPALPTRPAFCAGRDGYCGRSSPCSARKSDTCRNRYSER